MIDWILDNLDVITLTWLAMIGLVWLFFWAADKLPEE